MTPEAQEQNQTSRCEVLVLLILFWRLGGLISESVSQLDEALIFICVYIWEH